MLASKNLAAAAIKRPAPPDRRLMRPLRLVACCAALVLLFAGMASGKRVASAGDPKFSVEVPNGWQSEAKTNGPNQQIWLSSAGRTISVVGVEMKNGDVATGEAGALEWVRKNKYPRATVVTGVHTATFGSHNGHEMTLKDSSGDTEYGVWAGSFYVGRLVFVCIGVSPLDALDTAANDYRAIVATVQAGEIKDAQQTGQPQVSKPRLRDRIKALAKVLARVLDKIPVFDPNKKNP